MDAHTLAQMNERVSVLETALRAILKRHDNGKCSCGGCCLARGALEPDKRADEV